MINTLTMFTLLPYQILISGEFRQLMLYLAQEVQESQSHSESHYTPYVPIYRVEQNVIVI